MSKPDKPGELRDVTVSAISLVSKAANGQKFKIFKSEEEAPEEVDRDERGLFAILKEFFTGKAEVEKVEVVNKPDEEVEKSGRKISSSRLEKLREIQAIINEVLSELEENEHEEWEELTKEEVQKTVDEAFEKIKVDEAIQKAIAPLIERIEKIESARGFSNRVPEENIKKDESKEFWGEIF